MLPTLTRAKRVSVDSTASLSPARHRAAGVRMSNRARRQDAVHRALPTFEPLENRQMLSTYYVSLSGSDSNGGTSPSSAWKSINKVNSVHFNAGDSILFQGGQTFSGSLNFNSAGSTTTAVVVSSYGSGHATISSGTSNGLSANNISGLLIENLNFSGSVGSSSQDGVEFQTSSSRGNIAVENCTISGYGHAGIWVEGIGAGFNNSKFTNDTVFNCVDDGIAYDATAERVHSNAFVAYNNVYDIYGDGTSGNTGNGIQLNNVNGGTAEYNNVHDNGAKGGSGLSGIWTAGSNNILIQYNVVYNGHATRGADGDGIDLDLDTSNSTVQYNYVYNNDGAGLMMDQWKGDGINTNNIIRYNISQNNGRRNNYGGICVFGEAVNSYIYSNTDFVAPSSTGNPVALRIKYSALGGGAVSGLHISDNIFYTTGGIQLINIQGAENKGSNLTMTGNDYYAGGSSTYLFYGATYGSVSSLEAGTGVEKLNGALVGYQLNPLLESPGGGNITSASQLSSLSAYKLSSSSPVINKGVNVSSLYGAKSVSEDFFGDAVPQGGAYDIGAYESGGQVIGSPASGDPGDGDSGSTGTSTGGGTTTTAVGPAGWLNSDIGSVGVAGSSSYSNSSFSIIGGGTDVFNTADSFNFTYTTLSGDGSIVAEVNSLTDPAAYAKAGVMIRSTLDATSTEASMMICPNGTDQMDYRLSTGAASSATLGKATTPEWVKMTRAGSLLTGYISTDGLNWTQVSSKTIAMGTSVDIGLAVTSHNNAATATATFSNVAITDAA